MPETPLEQVPGWTAGPIARLRKSWINSAEQVVAVAATDGGIRSLAQQMNVSEPEAERLVDFARRALAPAKRAEMDQPFLADDRGMGAAPPRKEDGSKPGNH